MPRLGGHHVAGRLAPAAQQSARALRAEERAHDADAEDDEGEQQQHLDAVVDEELERRGPAAVGQMQHVVEQPDDEGQPEVVDERPEADADGPGAATAAGPSRAERQTAAAAQRSHPPRRPARRAGAGGHALASRLVRSPAPRLPSPCSDLDDLLTHALSSSLARRPREARDQRRRGQVALQPLVVVGHAHELDEAGRAELRRVDDRVADAPVAVLGPAAAAHVDEDGLTDRPRVGHVRVTEEDGRVGILVGHARHGRLRPVLEEVLVDAPRAAVHGEQVAGRRREREVVLERAQVGLDLVGHGLLRPRQRDGALGALLVGLVDAAAVAGLEADALVVVAHERGDAAVAHEQGDLVGRGSVADEVAERDRLRHPAPLDVGEDRLEARQVAVHVAEDGEGRVDARASSRGVSFHRLVFISSYLDHKPMSM